MFEEEEIWVGKEFMGKCGAGSLLAWVLALS